MLHMTGFDQMNFSIFSCLLSTNVKAFSFYSYVKEINDDDRVLHGVPCNHSFGSPLLPVIRYTYPNAGIPSHSILFSSINDIHNNSNTII